jgi:hypothetical protein
MKISNIALITLLISANTAFGDLLTCNSLFSAGQTIRKANYLAMNKYEKQSFLKNLFKAGDDLNPRSIGYDNLAITSPFKVFGKVDLTIDSKLMTAAKKVFKKYEEDSRESSILLVATVLYQPKSDTNYETDPWSVLISKRLMNARGQEILEPVAAYSIERSAASAGEAIVLIIRNFGGLMI